MGIASVMPANAQYADRYALVLRDAPLSSTFATRAEMLGPMSTPQRLKIESAQQTVRRELENRNIAVTGSASTLLNAVFVAASPDRVDEMKGLPGVLGVVRLRKYKPTLSQALQVMNASAAWGLVGGQANGGKGIKIGIIDSGIDQNHPSLQDPSLGPVQLPGGTRHATSDPAFTNSKVIVARSYVRQLALGTGTLDPTTSSPDDYSARDHLGHGTAVATCAAGNTSKDIVSINGMAPKAFVGSYKIFGSPQVNDFATDDVIIAALEDAIADGMDVISMSVGGPSMTGPLDTGAACGNPAGVACDLSASAFEAAAQKGALIIAAAGNFGAYGWVNYPTFGTISSPADAPSVLSVGAIANTHGFQIGVRVKGSSVPANLAIIPGQFTDISYYYYGALAAPLVDVSKLGNDGYLCTAIPANTLHGALALVQRGPQGAGACSFETKMQLATDAGAAGVIFYDYPGSPDYPFAPSGLTGFNQQAVFISNSDGANLKAFLASNPGYTVTIDPAATEIPLTVGPELSSYSSMGPALGTNAIKPDVLGVGGGSQNGDLIFMGAQSFDPLGDVYSSTGYIAAAGTSFATPLVAGAAALVKQAHPTYTAAQIRSALTNTTAQDVTIDDSGNPVGITQTGAGRVAVDAAIKSTVTVAPTMLSFGSIAAGTVSQKIPFTLTNTGTTPINLALAVVATTASTATLTLDKSTVPLAAGATTTVTATLSGTAPAAGLYSGAVTVTGGAVPLRIPFMYLLPSNLVDGSGNLFSVLGDGNDGTVGRVIPDGKVQFQITDAVGAPVVGAAVTFSVNAGSAPATLSQVSTKTDQYGMASAVVTLGSQAGTYSIEGCVGKCSIRNLYEYTFTGNVRNAPSISAGGIIGAAPTVANAPVAPGSYASIYGVGLSDVLDSTTTAQLPLAMDYVTVSFDVPSAGISVPGHLVFVSSGQINVQVPWELQGQKSAQVKVTVDGNPGGVVTLPLADYSPGLFEYGAGNAAAVDPNNLANPIITATNPVKRGGVLELFGNGLGPTNNQPASGDVAPLSPLATTKSPVTVTVGGQPATVLFSGLTPGLPGLYQINITVPTNIGTGAQPVVVTVGGVSSKATSITVN